ncbi:MAG: CPBP family intramembrane glutamic endopeptidase [Candidatus Limimorpha sp.]
MKKAVRFSVVLCVLSWAYAAFVYFGLGIHNNSDNAMLFVLCASIYMFMPIITAVLLQIIDKEKVGSTGLLRFKVRWPWLVAWLLPVVVVVLSMLVNSLFKDVELGYFIPVPDNMRDVYGSPARFVMISLVSGLFAGVTVNAVAAFGEEYGWRNYLVDAMRGKSFLTACLFTGIVWGFWHFPFILMGHNYPDHRIAGVFMMVLFCLALSPVELYLVLKSGSVFPAAIFHGTINALAGASTVFVKGGSDILNGVAGLSGVLALIVVTLSIFVYDKYISKDKIMSKSLDETLSCK